MTVSDPLLKELKACTAKLMQASASGNEITDDDINLLPFCQNVEQIFQKGLVQGHSVLGLAPTAQSWYWLEQAARIPSSAGPSYQLAVSAVRSCPKVGTPLGRLRLLVRTCLAKKCLHAPVEALVRGGSPRGVYDPAGSVLGDEILGEILLSVLLQCGRLAFRLDLANCSFLDASWLPPPVARLEFVPCRSLGVCITFVGGKAIVAAVETNSLAAEDDRIEAGDVLDELNGRHVTTSMRGQLASIMRSGSGKPVTVTVIKACYPGTLSLYPPLVGLLWQARLDPDRVRSGHCRAATEHQDNTCLPAVSAGRAVAYVGSDSTGARGDVREIERAVGAVLAAEAPRRADARLVVVECHEMGVRVLGADDGRVLLKHSYMEISSCGRTSTWPHHFAYIAGEQSCNIAESFTCFVFECRDEEHVDNILHSIETTHMPPVVSLGYCVPGTFTKVPETTYKVSIQLDKRCTNA